MSDNVPALIEENFGPAMRALASDKMRAFVLEFVQSGNKKVAVLAGGYAATNDATIVATASRLLHNPKIAAAVHEEQIRIIHADVPMALRTLRDICGNPTVAERDRLKAAEAILNRAGMSSTTRHEVDVLVTHQTDSEKDREIRALAKELGLDDKATQALLGHKPPIEDAEFTEVITPEMQAARDHKNELARAWSHRTPEERAQRNAELRARQSLDGKIARIQGALDRGEITEEEAADKEFEARLSVPSIEPDAQNDLAPETTEG